MLVFYLNVPDQSSGRWPHPHVLFPHVLPLRWVSQLPRGVGLHSRCCHGPAPWLLQGEVVLVGSRSESCEPC